jgi:ribosomal protein RSM22 (predicted rRNA methylase)
MFLSVFVLGVILLGCSKSAPDCNDINTKNMVIEISKGEILKQLRDVISNAEEVVSELTLSVEAVRTSNFNKDTGKYECAADLLVHWPKKDTRTPIIYTSELVDDGESFYVSVYGLEGVLY